MPDDRRLRVLALDTDSLDLTDFGDMEEYEAEVAVVDLRRSDDMNDWKSDDPWGSFVAAVDPETDETDLSAAVVLIHVAERFHERWLSSNRRFKTPEA